MLWSKDASSSGVVDDEAMVAAVVTNRRGYVQRHGAHAKRTQRTNKFETIPKTQGTPKLLPKPDVRFS